MPCSANVSPGYTYARAHAAVHALIGRPRFMRLVSSRIFPCIQKAMVHPIAVYMVSSDDEHASSHRLRSHVRSRRGGHDSESSSRSRPHDSHHRGSSGKETPDDQPSEGSRQHATSTPETRTTPREEEPQIQTETAAVQPFLGSRTRQREPSPRSAEHQRRISPRTTARPRQDSSHSRDVSDGPTGNSNV